jgi:hypothetical protein
MFPKKVDMRIGFHVTTTTTTTTTTHSLLSQASWGRLEMKPKRDEKQGDT